MNYSKILIKIRGTLDLSQEQLGKMLNVSFATINRWENGRSEPSKKRIFQIEKICSDNKISING